MKKLLYLLLLTPIIYLASCSSAKNELTPEPLPIEETIVGKTWKLLDTDAGWFHLNDNNTYLTKDYKCDTLEQFGTWELDGNVLIMAYTIGPIEYIERNTIIDYNDSLVKVQSDTSASLDVNIIFEIVTADVVRGCMDATYPNYNPLADCDDGSCIPPSIGDLFQGGIVFYLDGNGGGLIAAPTDQLTDYFGHDPSLGGPQNQLFGVAEWGCFGDNIPGADGIVIGTGYQNTMAIEAECSTPGTAAYICANLTLDGYNDWFLPSKDELNEMYLNIGQGNTLGLGNIGGFSDYWYWSSTMFGIPAGNLDYAEKQAFNNGYQYRGPSHPTNYVRAIRAF